MILTKAILCFALFSAVYSHEPESNHTTDCRKAESLFYSLCSPDPITLRTIQGLPGVVDYKRVNSTIDQKPEQVFSKLNAKITELTASLAKTEEERRASEGREGFCFVKYNGKCFWIETNYNGIPCHMAKVMCAARGGTPADIYSEEHYNMIKEYVRRQIPDGAGLLYLWLGIRFNVRTMTASLSDGTPAPFLKWHPGFPANNAGYSCIGFHVRVPWNTGNQDMYNHPDNTIRQGVLCQKD